MARWGNIFATSIIAALISSCSLTSENDGSTPNGGSSSTSGGATSNGGSSTSSGGTDSVDPVGVDAGQTILISGSVIDTGSMPLAGVTVRIEGTEIETQSDAQGSFSLAGEATEALNQLTLSVVGPGYFPTTVVAAGPETSVEPITLSTLRDVLTREDALIFDSPPTPRGDGANELLYVGEDFQVLTSVTFEGNDYALEWAATSSAASNSGTITISAAAATVARGPVTLSSKPYELIATAMLGGAEANVTFPVRLLSEPLTVLTWNIWGKNIGEIENGHTGADIVLSVMKHYDPDVLGLVETYGNVDFLHTGLGFEHSVGGTDTGSSGNLSVISRFPITGNISLSPNYNQLGAELTLSEERELAFVSSWFAWQESTWPGNTGDFTDAQGIASDAEWRLPEAKKLVDFLRDEGYLAGSSERPLFVVGDHNAISHLDFTEAMAGSDLNHGRGAIAAPVSLLFEAEGFVDSYRTVYPDPATHHAPSWSPLGSHHYRIDFIYHRGDMLVPVSSEFIGEVVGAIDGDFPSDHGGFVATYEWYD